MRFSKTAITLTTGLVVAPLVVSAFSTQKYTFVSKSLVVNNNDVAVSVHGPGCTCRACMNHSSFCSCSRCTSTSLRMSEVEVPAEVASLDGIDSDAEAHNAERPARGSGLHKHKKGERSNRTSIKDLAAGSSVEGKIKTITSYGAFVDIGATTDALLHVSRLSADFVSKVDDVVKAGDAVTVRIVSVDSEKNQIAVTMLTEEEEAAATARVEASRAAGSQRRKERPQRSGGDREQQVQTLAALSEAGYDEDKFVEGQVVSILDFGAFVRFDASQLAEGVTGELDGLVHISALCAGRANSVSELVTVGDKVNIRVKSLDVQGNKIGLSMISKEEETPQRAPRGSDDDNDNRPRRRGRQMFSETEMGAKDWKESLEKFQSDAPVFVNMPVIVNKRK